MVIYILMVQMSVTKEIFKGRNKVIKKTCLINSVNTLKVKITVSLGCFRWKTVDSESNVVANLFLFAGEGERSQLGDLSVGVRR